MKELKKRVMEYGKVAKECYARMQQLGVSYQDIGHVLGRYYNLGKPAGVNPAINPAGANPTKTIHNEEMDETIKKKVVAKEDLDRVCSWCKKSMGKTPSEKTGITHGMCPDCAKKMMADLPPKKAGS